MSEFNITTNFSGRQPLKSTYIKQFYPNINGLVTWIFKTINSIQFITPANSTNDVLIQTNLIVNGTITNPSDIKLKSNIENIPEEIGDNILKLVPKTYTYKYDKLNIEHYGLIAQDLELVFPKLVSNLGEDMTHDNTLKVVNYLELIPLLIVKIKNMQKQIDELNRKI
jgi:hypothetical protein